MNLPQLPPEPIRPEMVKPEGEKEIWQPRWRCFCCQDTGTVRLWLIRRVIPDYDDFRDKSVACQNPRCNAGEVYQGNPNYDQRFSAGICAELDRLSRSDWQQTVKNQAALIQERIKELARQKSLRKRDRTPTEEMMAQQRHQAVLDGWGVEANTPEEKQFVAACKEAMEEL